MESLMPIALGVVTGLLLGLTGAGGGIIAAPLLMLFMHLSLPQAAPISLIAVSLAAGFAMVLGLFQGVVRYRAALLMAGMGLLASPLGIRLAQALPNRLLLLAFALLLAYQAQRQWRGRQADGDDAPPCTLDAGTGRFQWNRPCAWAMGSAGFLAGLFSGLLGVGGGFVLVPALRRHTALTMHAITATSLMVLCLVSSGGVAIWIAQGQVLWTAAVPFAVGTVMGMAGGRYASPRIPARQLQRSFALMCGLASLGLLAKGLLG